MDLLFKLLPIALKHIEPLGWAASGGLALSFVASPFLSRALWREGWVRCLLRLLQHWLLMFVVAFSLYGLLMHLGAFSLRKGLLSVVMLWLGFVVPVLFYPQCLKRPFLMLLGWSVFWLCVLLVQASVFSFFLG